MDKEKVTGAETIHFSDSDLDVMPNGRAWTDRPIFKNLSLLWSVIRNLTFFVIIIGGYYLYQRDAIAQNTISLNDIAKDEQALKTIVDQDRHDRIDQLKELKSQTVTTEVFNAKADAIEKRLSNIETLLYRLNTK